MGRAKPGHPPSPPQQPQCDAVPLALLVEARRRSSCSRSRSLVQMDSSSRWRRLRISTKCSSSRSAPATDRDMGTRRLCHLPCTIPTVLPHIRAVTHSQVSSLFSHTQPGCPCALQHGPYLLASGWRGTLMAGPHKAAGQEGVHPRGCGSQGPQGAQPSSAAHHDSRAMLGLCHPLQRDPVGLWALLELQAASHLHTEQSSEEEGNEQGGRMRVRHPCHVLLAPFSLCPAVQPDVPAR